MGDFDPCVCIWNHEHAMQRLINILRNAQNFCTDSECIQELPGPNQVPGVGDYKIILIMVGWLVMATVLFLLRPAALRRRAGDEKPPPSNQDNNPPHDPPPGVH